jgi:membrane complex biogenesis BtpA family protein
MKELFGGKKPIIGMVNLHTLPGYDRFEGMDKVISAALVDAKNLEAGGISGILVENSFDLPHDNEIGPETIAAMSIAVHEIVKAVSVPVGVVVIMESGDISSLAVAFSAGAKFIRSVSFNEAMVSSFGIYQGKPAKLFRYKRFLGANNMKVFSDVHVKHSVPLVDRSIEDSILDAKMSGVDAIIVTGTGTGYAPPAELARRAKKASGSTPLILGSGVSPENISELFEIADGAIIGSYFKQNGVYTNPIDPKRVSELVKLV